MAFETAWRSGRYTGTGKERGPWVTHHEVLEEAFKAAGYETAPGVVYWNLESKLLTKGEMYQLPGVQRKLSLELASDSSSILCGACLAYDREGNHVKTVHFSDRTGCNGAIKHSGDTIVDGKSKHRIEVDMEKLPESVMHLFLTLCSCGP